MKKRPTLLLLTVLIVVSMTACGYKEKELRLPGQKPGQEQQQHRDWHQDWHGSR
ncbi:MAG: hypothetical protein HQL58_01395 [Magnetococcales bacterium]|nr:hypothetical protein [Magnetococcales bacterium]